MQVHELLFRSADANAEATAIVTASGAECTYGRLVDLTVAFARGLVAHGVARGDRVVIALDNSIEFVMAYLGAMAAGAVAVPLPAGPRSDRLPKAIADCAPVAVVTDAATLSALPPPARSVLRLQILVRADAGPAVTTSIDAVLSAGRRSGRPLPRGIDLDLAAVVYTSGSSGEPRGVMLSHLNLVSNTRSIIEYLALTPNDRVLVVLPFHYVYGLSLLQTHLAVGGSLILENRLAFPALVLQALSGLGATGFAGVPSTYTMLLQRTTLSAHTFPSLRYVTQAGGPMSRTLIRAWRAALPAVPLYVMYGATEAAARLTYLPPADLDRKAGSIGTAIPNVDVNVVRPDGSLCAPGEVGELVARGSNIMLGYWNRPAETADALGPRGYRTGDLGYADEEGYLFIVGRRTDMMKVGAHRVGAAEIEDAVSEHPDVAECAVVGEADELMGEVPVAFVVVRPECAVTDADLRAFCRRTLPEHKVPVRTVVMDALPRNDNGKVDKRILRALVGAGTAGAGAS